MTAAAAGTMPFASAAEPAEAPALRQSGTLSDGSTYALERPAEWNGDLVVLPGRETLDATAVRWLVEQGYGAVGYDLSSGWDLERDRDNAEEALGVFEDAAGEADAVVVAGRSQGGLVTRIIADRQPEWLDGALPMCGGGAGAISTWNYKLDTAFALKELVDPDSPMALQGITDRAAEVQALNDLVDAAASTPEGRARTVLAAALSKIPATDPTTGEELEDLDQRIDRYLEHMPFAAGSHVRHGYEQTVGGTFSWNTGVDYEKLLKQSGRWAEIRAAYRQAGLSLQEDLHALDTAERFSADVESVEFVERTATFSGELSAPLLSLHTTGDGAGTTADDAAYASTVRSAGSGSQLRQVFVAADGHCTFTAAEEATAFTVLFDRIDSGRWDATSPRALERIGAQVNDASALEVGETRFTRAQHSGAPVRMWDYRNWGDYTG
ncbi:MAG: prolyl oligopeptidase family serine peptidase [Citricoccus sp.]|nr:prolyl oligopeptidase family serine peptidase [Citricoccus sp. WCRC_4]